MAKVSSIHQVCSDLIAKTTKSKPITFQMIRKSPLGRWLNPGQIKGLVKKLNDGTMSKQDLGEIYARHHTPEDPTGKKTYVGTVARAFFDVTRKDVIFMAALMAAPGHGKSIIPLLFTSLKQILGLKKYVTESKFK